MAKSNLTRCQNGHLFSKRRYGTVCPYCNIETATKEKQETGRTEVEIEEDLFREDVKPVCGWIVCIDGPRQGKDYQVVQGKNFVGRADDMDIQILGDNEISRRNHAVIVFDPKKRETVLLPGDANRLGYGEIAPADLCAHIFKVGHHGQRDGADAALIQAVRPRAAVCCASSDRRYQSAHPELLRFLLDNGIDLWFSDCPQLPGLDLPPHEALVFSIGEEGAFQAEYTRGGSPYETAI